MPTTSVFRRVPAAVAVGATAIALAASTLAAPTAEARPLGSPAIGGSSSVLGTGCYYAVGIRVAPDKPTATDDRRLSPKEKKDQAKKDKANRWVSFWDMPAPGEPKKPGRKLIGRALPDAKGVAIVRWTPQQKGFRSVMASQGKRWSLPAQITVDEAVSIGRLCVLRFW